MAVPTWCLSFRQQYAGLVLDGVKTLETRWIPILAPLQSQTLANHIAWRDWEGDEWREVLGGRMGINVEEIGEELESGERFGRGLVAVQVEVGRTWQCPASLAGEELERLERSAVLIGLLEKHGTDLLNPAGLRDL